MPVDLPENALTTVEAVTSRFGSSLGEERIAAAIAVASELIEGELKRSLGYAEVTAEDPEWQRGDGGCKLYLDRAPLMAITQVLIDGEPDEEWSRMASLDGKGVLYREDGWPARRGVCRDLTRDPAPELRGWNIAVAYQAGFTLPKDLGSPANADAPRLPYSIEEVAITECLALLTLPVNRHILEERTVGGHSRKYAAGGPAAQLSGASLQILSRSPLRRIHV